VDASSTAEHRRHLSVLVAVGAMNSLGSRRFGQFGRFVSSGKDGTDCSLRGLDASAVFSLAATIAATLRGII
jgi:hypothetical protein